MAAINENLLDSEFRQILYLIKPHIFSINNPYHIEQYKVWLERLNDATSGEKLERNKYMVELANQIHDGVLQAPFTFKPPNGTLPRLKSYEKNTKPENQWPYVREKSPQKKKISPRFNIGRPFQVLGKTFSEITNNNQLSESSWYDLSEVSASTCNNQAQGDTDLEDSDQRDNDDEETKEILSKISMEQHRKTALKIKEKYEKKHQELGKLLTEKVPGFDMNKFYAWEKEEKCKTPDAKDIAPQSPTSNEIEALKQRMMDLMEVKNALKDTHSLTQDRKKAIETLTSKVEQLEKRNSEMRRIVNVQKRKITEMEQEKSKELKEFKDTFTNLRSTEIDFVKQRHCKEIKSLEKKHEIRIQELDIEYKRKLEDLKKNYEAKISDLVNAHSNMIKEKDNEIKQLMNEAKARGDDTVSINQTIEINHLKRCISKLDKLLNKNEKEYVKKVEKLRQEIEMKDTVTQVQLHTQRAELIVKNSANRQEELTNSLNNLEAKYKKLMDDLQNQALSVKKQDEKVIEVLKSLLDVNGISYNI